MIEKGSRKTAPPDTARVKVHKYNLQMESNTQVLAEIKNNVDNKVIILFFFKSDYMLKMLCFNITVYMYIVLIYLSIYLCIYPSIHCYLIHP